MIIAHLPDYPRSLCWSPDGRHLAVGLAGGHLHVLSAEGILVRSWLAHARGLLALGWNPHRPLLASTGEDGAVRLWDATTGQRVMDAEGGAAWVEHAAWSPDGRQLVTAGGRTLKTWSSEGRLLEELGGFTSTVSAVAWEPHGRWIAASAYGGVRLWSPGSTEGQDLRWRSSLVSLAVSPDGRHLAAGTQENSVIYWTLPSDGAEPLQMSGYAMKVKHLGWDPGSRFLATGGGEVATVWDVSGNGPAGTRPNQLAGHPTPITALEWRPTGGQLATGSRDGEVRLWNPRAAATGMALVPAGAEIVGLRWSPTGKSLAAASAAGTLFVRIL